MLASHLKFSKYYKLMLFWCLFYLWICWKDSIKCIVKNSDLLQGNIIKSYHQFEVYKVLLFCCEDFNYFLSRIQMEELKNCCLKCSRNDKQSNIFGQTYGMLSQFGFICMSKATIVSQENRCIKIVFVTPHLCQGLDLDSQNHMESSH